MNVVVGQALLDDDAHHGVEERDVGARLDRQPLDRVVGKPDLARVDDVDAGASAGRLLELDADDRVRLGGVRADAQHDVGLAEVGDRVRHRSASERCGQTGHRGAVSKTGAVVDVVRADRRAQELLEQVVLLVGALRRGQARYGVGSVLVANAAELLGDERDRFVPALPRRARRLCGPAGW